MAPKNLRWASWALSDPSVSSMADQPFKKMGQIQFITSENNVEQNPHKQ